MKTLGKLFHEKGPNTHVYTRAHPMSPFTDNNHRITPKTRLLNIVFTSYYYYRYYFVQKEKVSLFDV